MRMTGTVPPTSWVVRECLEAGARWKCVELAAYLLNAGDAVWREGQFAVQSRVPGEGANPPVGMSFTPGIPRTALASVSVYW